VSFSSASRVSRTRYCFLPRSPAERLAREALFLLAFGSRPAIRTALLEALGAR